MKELLQACRGLLRALCGANLIAKGRRGERLKLYSLKAKAGDVEWLAYEAANLGCMVRWFLEGQMLERAGKKWTPVPWAVTKAQARRLKKAGEDWIAVARELP